jgi:hypothetical protein
MMNGKSLLQVGERPGPQRPPSIEVYGFENEAGKAVIVRMVNAGAVMLSPRAARQLAIELLRKADEIEDRTAAVGSTVPDGVFDAG